MFGFLTIGDLLLLFGRVAEARAAWMDAVDGLFNTIDMCSQPSIWMPVCAAVTDAIHSESVNAQQVPFVKDSIVSGLIPAIAILGKLSKYCASADWDARSNFCRLAATLSLLPFSESLGHPQTPIGFSAYECIELSAPMGLSFCAEVPTLATNSLICALKEV